MACCRCKELKWKDPQEVVYTDSKDGKEYCLFHAPAEHKGMDVHDFNAQVSERIQATIDLGDDDATCRLCGTIFPGDIGFDKDCVLPDMAFTFCRFMGTADFCEVHIKGGVFFGEAHIKKAAKFEKAHIKGGAKFWGAEIGREANFLGTEIGGEADFFGAEIGGEADFFGAEIGGEADFSEAKIERGLNFWRAKIGGGRNFHRTPYR